MGNELFDRAVALAGEGRREEACSLLKQAVTLDPMDEPAWLWYMDLLGSDEERIQALEDSLQSAPDARHPLRLLAQLREKQAGQGMAAETDWTQVIEEAEAQAGPSSLFAFDPDVTGEEAGLPSVSPFTVPPEEVTPADLEIAEYNLLAAQGAVILPAEDSGEEEDAEPTQPVKLKANPSLPDAEEIEALFHAGEAGELQPIQGWTPTFSDEGERSASRAARRRAIQAVGRRRPAERDGGAAAPGPEPTPPPAGTGPLQAQPERARRQGLLGRLDQAAQAYRPEDLRRILVLLAVGVGVILILSVVVIVVLLMG